MNKFVSTLLIVAVVAVDVASAFAAIRPSSSSSRSSRRADGGVVVVAPSSSSFVVRVPSSAVVVVASSSGTTTALRLKVKIDPEAKNKGNKNVAGNAKMAAYGGSVVIALLLPIAFLVWSAVSK